MTYSLASSFPRGMRKEQRDIVRRLIREGWTAEVTGGGHVKLVHPNGGVVYTSMSSSNRWSWRRLQRNVEQVERGERPT